MNVYVQFSSYLNKKIWKQYHNNYKWIKHYKRMMMMIILFELALFLPLHLLILFFLILNTNARDTKHNSLLPPSPSSKGLWLCSTRTFRVYLTTKYLPASTVAAAAMAINHFVINYARFRCNARENMLLICV